ncbi:MAG: hypothetical protein A3A44_02465 [Candidatus Sungbacteria bacterium RIFCSPLOWO2_01_FULL_60_25]|uniref:Prevent-host-death protein n=1 Tax=Candidatus Sungbacteria bacterium RIFCSPLOWO2_01_FULL_60_25 TaxID=1802281 RepID=A0A1G2LBX6_9BACT|nr:MAG: hypothetical protein A3A44_02465 [Candidatus Sungbacteria bacterium RIFCSPLOWO2_01_FULL_60_25]
MFDQLTSIIQPGERYIVVEDGKPQYVIMRFSDYAAFAGGRSPAALGAGREADLGRVNAEFQANRARPVDAPPELLPTAPAAVPDLTGIRLEDLAL